MESNRFNSIPKRISGRSHPNLSMQAAWVSFSKWCLNIDAVAFFKYRLNQAFDDLHQILGNAKTHLYIDLGEFRLSVGA